MRLKLPPLSWLLCSFWSLLLAWCLLLAWPSGMVAADLPPRPEETPTPVPQPPDPVHEESAGEGATIELRVSPNPGQARTLVQWQDGLGAWHDVTGWQGELLGDGRIAWWVAPKDFKTGPFRWVVYQGQSDVVQGMSEAFYLPQQSHEIVIITIGE